MVGRPVPGVRSANTAPAADADLHLSTGAGTGGEAGSRGPAVLELAGVSVDAAGSRPVVDDVSLSVFSGEIVGVAGVSGNGQRELVDVLCGVRVPSAGRVTVGGKDVTRGGPGDVMSAGLGRIPEDRHGSVVAEMSVEHNLVLEDLAAFRKGPSSTAVGCASMPSV